MRFPFLDFLRGMAVLWMITFHGSYDLKIFGFVDWNFNEGFWYGFPRVIAFTFLFCVGMSLNYTHGNKINWPALKKRSTKLFLAAGVISLVTYFVFPAQWIYFGTLHCILVGSVLGTVLVNRRPLAWVILLLILLAQYGLNYDIKWVSAVLQRPSLDFIPIYPWFWGILAGMLAGPYLSKNSFLANFPDINFLTILGRHSLKIYLIHQPIIYGVFWGLKILLNP